MPPISCQQPSRLVIGGLGEPAKKGLVSDAPDRPNRSHHNTLKMLPICPGVPAGPGHHHPPTRRVHQHTRHHQPSSQQAPLISASAEQSALKGDFSPRSTSPTNQGLSSNAWKISLLGTKPENSPSLAAPICGRSPCLASRWALVLAGAAPLRLRSGAPQATHRHQRNAGCHFCEENLVAGPSEASA